MTKPVKARPLNPGDEAWFYKNPKSIDIYCYRKGAATLSCRITRRQLEAWMKATECTPEDVADFQHFRNRAREALK